MFPYLLEFRYSGYPWNYFRNIHNDINRRFGKIGHSKSRYVPHITVAGPFKILFQGSLIKKIENIFETYTESIRKPGSLVKTGKYMKWNTTDGKTVIAVRIYPPNILKQIKNELETTIQKGWFSKCITYPDPLWHTTVAITRRNNHYDKAKIQKAWNFIKNHPPQNMKFILDRVTLLKNREILREFDLINGETLDREESLDNNKRKADYLKLKKELIEKGEEFQY